MGGDLKSIFQISYIWIFDNICNLHIEKKIPLTRGGDLMRNSHVLKMGLHQGGGI